MDIPHRTPKERPLQLLLVGPREEDFFLIRDILARLGKTMLVELDHAHTVEEADALLARRTYHLVLFQEEAGDPVIAGILRRTCAQEHPTPFLVLREDADEAMLAEMLAADAPDCMTRKELGQPSFMRTVRCAALLHRREQDFQSSQHMLKKLHSAVEQSADMVVITDRAGKIEYVNPAFEKTTGYHRDEVLGSTPRILKSGEHGDHFYRELWKTVGSGNVFRGVMINRKKTGESFVVEKTITPVRDANGEITNFISNDRDVSDFRKLEAALFQAHTMDAIGKLAGGVAHDFNNLLMIISSYAELMLDEIPAGSSLQRRAQEILNAARRAADLTRQLLAFWRKQPQQLQVVNLNVALHDTAKMLPHLIGEDIELRIIPGTDLARVRIDPVHFEQIVINLAANARDAMPGGGRLCFETKVVDLDKSFHSHTVLQPGRYVLLEVTDSGAGISPEHLPHIFEPFYTTKAQGKGTGLGLATVYGIVKQSGGHIWVYSEAEVGTCFKIYFPVVTGASRAEGTDSGSDPIAKEPARSDRGYERILLVEDEESVRRPAAEFLQHSGYNVLEAGNGAQALEVVANSELPIDLVVTDVVMPGMSGGALAEHLSTTTPASRILFVSGYAEQVVIDHHIVDVHRNFLQKPFTLRELAAKIRETLDRRDCALGEVAGS
jgi:two-component system cell cycle sensor histidine kinase/response regulator CckA